LNVLGEVKHQFKPIGATPLYLLSESHLSVHTYPEKNYCAIDLYCCNPNIDMVETLNTIYKYFDKVVSSLKKNK
jgi:S-adenosylmethionine decarboxylase